MAISLIAVLYGYNSDCALLHILFEISQQYLLHWLINMHALLRGWRGANPPVMHLTGKILHGQNQGEKPSR
jgi:hypothetical protein